MEHSMTMICAKVLLAATLMCAPGDLRQRMSSLAAPVGGHVGAAVMIVETGEMVSWNGMQHFPMQSVYKVPIAMAVLKRVDEGALRLDQKIQLTIADLIPRQGHSPIRDKYPRAGVALTLREFLRAAIVDSDGTASDVLLRLVTPNEVNSYLHKLGVDDLMVVNFERELASDEQVQYRNWTTPEASVRLLRLLQEGQGLSVGSRRLLLEWMTRAQSGVRRIRGLLPAGTAVADKTGTSGTSEGLTRATNDIGLITLPDGRHLAIAVFVSDSAAPRSVREGVIAKIARAAWDCVVGPLSKLESFRRATYQEPQIGFALLVCRMERRSSASTCLSDRL
jgi:beta-lactamase class A